MRRLARRLFTLCSTASLLLWVAACVLWVRSYAAERDYLYFHSHGDAGHTALVTAFYAAPGVFGVEHTVWVRVTAVRSPRPEPATALGFGYTDTTWQMFPGDPLRVRYTCVEARPILRLDGSPAILISRPPRIFPPSG